MCYTPFLGAEMLEGYIQSGDADAEISNNIGHTTVAVTGDTIQGFVVCVDDLVHLLMTRLNTQRAGIGSRLLAHCEHEIAGRGYQSARLETFSDNRQARQFYHKAGWREIRLGEVEGLGVPLVFLRKDL